MYRWNSRSPHISSKDSSSSNLSTSSSLSSVRARRWIWNAIKAFVSLLSSFSCVHGRKLNQIINCTRCFSLCSSASCSKSNLSSVNSHSHNNSSSSSSSSIFCCWCSIWKDHSSQNSLSSSTNITTTNNCTTAKNKPRTGKMAQILSRTMTLLGVAFVIHFIIMSTFAEKEGRLPEYSSASMSTSLREIRRQPRSYRAEKHPSPAPISSNIVASMTAPRPPDKNEALFATENSTVVTAQIGSTANLPCIVKNNGNGVGSWIRRRDYHLLTAGMGTYSNDERFFVSHTRPNQNWELHIKSVRLQDEGIYECQISSHPPSSIFINLRVVEAKAEILGEPDKHVRSGSTFELVCVLRDSTEPPVYVFWYHNDRMINYDNVRGVVVNSDPEKSILTIQEAQKTDSGNYTCVPSNARPTSISVHILNGEKPAAMQHGSRNHSPRQVSSSVSLLFVSAVAVFLVTTWLATPPTPPSVRRRTTRENLEKLRSKPHHQCQPHQHHHHHHHHHHHLILTTTPTTTTPWLPLNIQNPQQQQHQQGHIQLFQLQLQHHEQQENDLIPGQKAKLPVDVLCKVEVDIRVEVELEVETNFLPLESFLPRLLLLVEKKKKNHSDHNNDFGYNPEQQHKTTKTTGSLYLVKMDEQWESVCESKSQPDEEKEEALSLKKITSSLVYLFPCAAVDLFVNALRDTKCFFESHTPTPTITTTTTTTTVSSMSMSFTLLCPVYYHFSMKRTIAR